MYKKEELEPIKRLEKARDKTYEINDLVIDSIQGKFVGDGGGIMNEGYPQNKQVELEERINQWEQLLQSDDMRMKQRR